MEPVPELWGASLKPGSPRYRQSWVFPQGALQDHETPASREPSQPSHLSLDVWCSVDFYMRFL